MSRGAALLAELKDPSTRPRAVLLLSVACAITVSVAWPLLRTLLAAGAVAAR